ncbi:hypothetical protein BS47DRAFT_1344759 [Hydnum rufescens UP504]|uniref:C2H2-type domain-containing protein n=1 Tax=Hydnum rufescens UP504 TaxID=1448309 RepID=A0A9P6AW65_9AGAM|nr:hypothetical protein BS47DRAFT_1344759 [Hydnum rufescens UP504]
MTSPSDGQACLWEGCSEVSPDAELLYIHLCNEHIGRKSTNNLCLTCKWKDCGTTCAKRDHITSHLRVHTPLKPHVCEICNKTFKRPQDLKKHEKIHTQEHHARHRHSKAITVPDPTFSRRVAANDSPPTRSRSAHRRDDYRRGSTDSPSSQDEALTPNSSGTSPPIPHSQAPIQRPWVDQPTNHKRPSESTVDDFFHDVKRRRFTPAYDAHMAERLSALSTAAFSQYLLQAQAQVAMNSMIPHPPVPYPSREITNGTSLAAANNHSVSAGQATPNSYFDLAHLAYLGIAGNLPGFSGATPFGNTSGVNVSGHGSTDTTYSGGLGYPNVYPLPSMQASSLGYPTYPLPPLNNGPQQQPQTNESNYANLYPSLDFNHLYSAPGTGNRPTHQYSTTTVKRLSTSSDDRSKRLRHSSHSSASSSASTSDHYVGSQQQPDTAFSHLRYSQQQQPQQSSRSPPSHPSSHSPSPISYPPNLPHAFHSTSIDFDNMLGTNNSAAPSDSPTRTCSDSETSKCASAYRRPGNQEDAMLVDEIRAPVKNNDDNSRVDPTRPNPPPAKLLSRSNSGPLPSSSLYPLLNPVPEDASVKLPPLRKQSRHNSFVSISPSSIIPSPPILSHEHRGSPTPSSSSSSSREMWATSSSSSSSSSSVSSPGTPRPSPPSGLASVSTRLPGVSAILSTSFPPPSSSLPPLTPRTANIGIAPVPMEESLVRDIDRMGIHTAPTTPDHSSPTPSSAQSVSLVSRSTASQPKVNVSLEDRRKHAELVQSLLMFVNREFVRRHQSLSHGMLQRRESFSDQEEHDEMDELEEASDWERVRERGVTPTPPLPTPILRRIVV